MRSLLLHFLVFLVVLAGSLPGVSQHQEWQASYLTQDEASADFAVDQDSEDPLGILRAEAADQPGAAKVGIPSLEPAPLLSHFTSHQIRAPPSG